jgi:SH3 domain protein
MKKYLLTGLLFMFASPVALAQDTETETEATIEVVEKPREMLYVTDQLRLSLYPNANDRSKALEYLASGDKLGVLEIEGNYALVIAPTGRRGWVKRGFLLPQPTSKLLLKAEKKINQDLRLEIDKLSNSKIVIDQYERDMDELTKNLKFERKAKENAEEMMEEMETAAREKAELEAAIKAA